MIGLAFQRLLLLLFLLPNAACPPTQPMMPMDRIYCSAAHGDRTAWTGHHTISTRSFVLAVNIVLFQGLAVNFASPRAGKK
jgi:hypothetical protein